MDDVKASLHRVKQDNHQLEAELRGMRTESWEDLNSPAHSHVGRRTKGEESASQGDRKYGFHGQATSRTIDAREGP